MTANDFFASGVVTPRGIRPVIVAEVRTNRKLRLNDLAPDHVELLKAVLDEVPPILVDEKSMEVIDGAHRLCAAKELGRTHIQAHLIDGDEIGLLLAGICANTKHGLPLSLKERQNSALRILEVNETKSDRWIAEMVGLSPGAIASLRRRSTVHHDHLNDTLAPGVADRVGKDGRRIPLSTAAGKQRAAELFRERPHRPIRQVAQEAGISVGTAHAVKVAVLRNEHGLAAQTRPAGASTGQPADSADPCRSAHVAAHRPNRPRDGATSPAASAAQSNPSSASTTSANTTASAQSDPSDWASRSVIARMVKDPSVVQSEAGRRAVRSLQGLSLGRGTSEYILQGVPSHYLDEVLRLIRDSLDSWSVLIAMLGARQEC